MLGAEGYPWIGCECCKGAVWVPFKMLRERIPMLSAMTFDQLGAKMKCDRCGKRPERYYPAKPERHARVRSKLLDVPVPKTCAHEKRAELFSLLSFLGNPRRIPPAGAALRDVRRR